MAWLLAPALSMVRTIRQKPGRAAIPAKADCNAVPATRRDARFYLRGITAERIRNEGEKMAKAGGTRRDATRRGDHYGLPVS